MATRPERRMRLEVLALAALAAASASAQQPAPVAPDPTLLPYASTKDMARLPDGRTIHFVCTGRGSPTVLLSAGAGDWGVTWSQVQPRIAERTRVCAWDRAAFGLSSPPPHPQTVDQSTSDLEAALKAAGIGGPYVLVGHSLGGYESLLFADRHRADVAGMVLVDPAVPDQFSRFARAAPAIATWTRDHPHPLFALLQTCGAALRAGTVRPGADPDHCLGPPPWPASYPPEVVAALNRVSTGASPERLASTMDSIAVYLSPQLLERNSKIVVNRGRDYGAMPLIVLTAGAFEEPPGFSDEAKAQIPAFQAEWRREHDALAALSTRGVNRVVAGSSHYIQSLKPQAVIDAVEEVVDAARDARRSEAHR